MHTSNPKPNPLLPSTRRLEALSDCVYSIAMTLLVLNVKLPNIPAAKVAHVLPEAILGLISRLHDYLVSFLVLGSLWLISHQQFHYIRNVNRTLLWINLLILMFITLIPFSASLVGDYGDQQISVLFFDGHLLVLNLLFLLNRYYAINRKFLEPAIDPVWRKRIGNQESLLNFALIAWSIVWSFFSPRWSQLPFLLMPFTPIFARNLVKI
ncbi:hypothetical protein SAMD00079811_79260 (plasmid) [Scytonema sp. HK-05]|uniref:TMEM175 family protein n=1 Tax=Scytonema sp. HK-05 TaxID=1137095 RepID=UPI000937B032|nr:TMEM175 family protein [Scytonema sp. HK-05]OKH57091.1 hypothetical protein NIES2130_21895 [Scytonema sp. HK-05]BAY50297.1 hypothetical protein SAMD00079811_79260 [Scytonema sp. HK-05]